MKNVALYLAVAAIAAACASKETQTDAPVTDRSAGVSQPSRLGAELDARASATADRSPATRCATPATSCPSAASSSTTTRTR